MMRTLLNVFLIFAIGALGGIFADQILWPYLVEQPLLRRYHLEQGSSYFTETKEITVQENVALTNAIEKVDKAVVGIRTKLKTGKVLEGSGLIVSSDGLVVTFADLVPQDATPTLFWEGRSPSFQVIKRDLKENLALLKMSETNLKTVGFADLDKTRLGERIFLLGVVFEKIGTGQRFEVKQAVNEGVIRSFGLDYLQTNILEKDTVKGSPLFDIEGNVLGLNTIDKDGKVITLNILKLRKFIGL